MVRIEFNRGELYITHNDKPLRGVVGVHATLTGLEVEMLCGKIKAATPNLSSDDADLQEKLLIAEGIRVTRIYK